MTNTTSSKMSVEDMIGHYQRSIERSQHDPKRRMQVTVQHLQSTGIGRTVNSLRKDDGEVGAAAKTLISKWKEMVANDASDGSEEEKPQDYEQDGEDVDVNEDENEDEDDEDDSSRIQTDSMSNSERKSHSHSHKHHEHTSHPEHMKSSSSNSNHHNHHHQHREHHSSNSHSHQRKYSSDDTQEHVTHSKHNQKSHDDGSSSKSRKREREHEHDNSEYDRHKSSSKHSKEERHHRSRHENQQNGDADSDKKHRNKDHDKHSDHHKSHSSSKHKRSRESEHLSSSPKKPKCDSIAASTKSDEKKSSKSKFKAVDDGIEIDQSMGTSFADALGMLAPMPMASKASTSASSVSANSSKSSNKSSTVSPSSSSGQSKNKIKEKSKPSTLAPPSLLLKKPKLPPLEDLAKDLPPPAECIIPNDYKPSPINPMVMDILGFPKGPKAQTMLSETDSLCASTTSKNQRTKVYSGVKSGALLTVPSLHELCIRFLQKNIDALEFTGGVPFEILKPVLERASPEQLHSFEHYNPYLVDDSDCLWQQHCQRKFKAYKRQEMETWREMYYRCMTEQEKRLSKLTRNIKESQSVALPVRQTKLAYVDSMVKPPRNVIKKQNQFGTHRQLIATPASRTEALSGVAANITKIGDVRLRTTANMRDTAQAQPSNGAIKPKKAPLMAKTLQFMKGRFKR